ncbi:MAG: DNA repair protein RecO C-terminal domain-containing protein, partial [Bacteroidales bacterium]|nr:DNA repair protein RecO C-terminal domain-containing protein [Bacteroidales bacterium]
LFQPLSILDLVVYEKPGRDMQNTKEVKFDHPYSSILYDIRKSSILVFLNELIFKSVKEEEANLQMFQYIYHSLIYLDEMKSHFQNFHLVFMLQLSRYLGFSPADNFTAPHQSFDMQEGDYTSSKLHESLIIQPPYTQHFYELSRHKAFGADLKISITERQVLTQRILQYYQIHLPSFSDMKSLDVLREVFK